MCGIVRKTSENQNFDCLAVFINHSHICS